MKKYLFLNVCVLFLAIGVLGAQAQIPVAPGDGTLKEAIATANPGDVLVLESGGEYTETADSAYFIDKPLMIMAAEGSEARPVLTNQSRVLGSTSPQFFILKDGSSLTLQGLELDGLEPTVLEPDPVPTYQSVDDVFQIDTNNDVKVGYLKIYDCLIKNTTDNVLEAYDPDLYGDLTGVSIDTVIAENCLFTNSYRFGIRDVGNAYLKLENCTFWDYPDMAMYIRDACQEIIVNHCTFNNVGTEILWNAGSPDEMMRFRGGTITDLTITNSIFANGSTDAPIRSDDGYNATISHLCMWNTTAFNVGTLAVTDTMRADPMFADAANGDFTLGAESPCYFAGNDGKTLGDLRWENYVPVEVAVIPGDGTLKEAIATANPGDVLVLESGGEYTETADSAYFIDKPLMIMAAEGSEERPVLKNLSQPYGSETPPQFFILGNGSSLTLQGLELDGLEPTVLEPDPVPTYQSVDDVFQIDTNNDVKVGYLKIYDCLIKNTTDNIVEFYDPDLYGDLTGVSIDSIIAENSLFTNAYRFGVRDIANQYFKLENCTFWDFPDFAIYIRDACTEVIVNHCTFNNVGTEILWNAGSPDEMMRFRGDTITDLTITNSILANGSSDAPIRSDDGYNAVISHLCMWNTAAFNVGTLAVTDTMRADPMFADAANGDFTLGAGSPCYFAGNDGKTLGDLRWENYMPVEVVVAPGDGTLKEAIATANPGDVLVLESGGEYTETADSAYFIDKSLMIMAAEGSEARPVLTNQSRVLGSTSPQFFILKDGSSLTLQGLELDGLEPNVLEPDPVPTYQSVDDVFLVDPQNDTKIGYLKIYDCLIKNTTDNILEAYDKNLYSSLTGVSIDTVVAENCLFTNSYRFGIRDVANEYFELENCTFWDFPDNAIYIRDACQEIIVNHCTFNNVGTEILWNAGSPDEIMRFRGGTITDLTITNSILANGSSDAPIRSDDGYNAVISHLCMWNTTAFNVGTLAVTDTMRADPMFADAANGDFTLAAESPCRSAGSDGEALGDLRWADGTGTAVENELSAVPTEYMLNQNYPNPFNPVTTISFTLKEANHTVLSVFNVLGQEVIKLVDQKMQMGVHQVKFDASTLESGVYFYHIKSGEYSSIKKMVLVK